MGLAPMMLQNDIIMEHLSACGRVGVAGTEEVEDVVVLDDADRSKLVVVFDPLDGSSNISSSIPTGGHL
jgi:fructose-1,6-bisphosphatase